MLLILDHSLPCAIIGDCASIRIKTVFERIQRINKEPIPVTGRGVEDIPSPGNNKHRKE
jgi:hypothetical protein